MPEHPESFEELFRFYHNYVKILYSSVQAENHLPVELLFELNAALDHVSRHWVYQESEKESVRLAYSHLKRCCLDVFKLRVKTAIDQYKELNKVDLSLIDNGTFENKLRALHQKIKQGASEARRLEGRTKEDKDGSVQAFAAWEPVFEDCVRLEKEFYFHSGVNWAKRVGFWRSTRALIGSIITTAVVMVFLRDPLVAGLHWIGVKLGLLGS